MVFRGDAQTMNFPGDRRRRRQPRTAPSMEGSKLYVTLFPCNECAKAIIQAGIKTIVYKEDKYPDSPSVRASKRMLNAAGVRYYQYEITGRKIEIDV